MQGGIYRHHKGPLYRVLFTAWESTNGMKRELCVVYVSLGKGTMNVRRFEEFTGRIETGERRFTFIGEGE